MRYLLIGLLVIFGSNIFAQSNARPEVGAVSKVYTGQEGLQITTCRLGDESKSEALVKVSGIDHPWNNRVFKAKLTRFKNNSVANNFNMDYEIEWKGKKYRILAGSGDSPGLFTAYLMPYASQQVEHRLKYDKDQSAYTSSERLLTEYLEQGK